MLPPEYIDAVNQENKLNFNRFIEIVSSSNALQEWRYSLTAE
tara:strand:+ start:604 stop:729 length:126 start_codon:yes stop_codon:yes gene_type:complete